MKGLEQSFKSSTGKVVFLKEVLTKDDWWELKKGRSKVEILTHSAIQKIADLAGIDRVVAYTILIEPSYTNNYQLSIEAKITRNNECVNEIGEVNRSNLGKRGKNNPTNMAQKRAFDRAVLRLLGIEGMLSEEELADADDTEMDHLTIDQQKKVAPLLSEIILCKSKTELNAFSKKMKTDKSNYTEDEITYLRKLWKKQLSELTSAF